MSSNLLILKNLAAYAHHLMMNHVENHFVFLDNDRGEIDGPAL